MKSVLIIGGSSDIGRKLATYLNNNGYNVLSSPNYEELYNKIVSAKIKDENKTNYYGDGRASEKIATILEKIWYYI